MSKRLSIMALVGLGLTVSTSLIAQSSTTGASALGPPARAVVDQIADSMRVARLPVEPLYAKVAEGKLKDATDSAIVAAVRALARRQMEVRSALGPRLDAGAIGAAATALKAGVPIKTLQQISQLIPGCRDANGAFTVALVTVVDLMGQRVPLPAAVTSMESLLERCAVDDQYTRLRLGVEADVVAGQSPEAAARARTEAIVKTLPAPPKGAPARGPGGPEIPRD